MINEKKNLIVFGYGLSIILLFWSWSLGRKHGIGLLNIAFISMAIGLAVLTFWRWELLRGFYNIWMIGARFIGLIVTSIILAIIYYMFFSTLAFVIRLTGKDFLDRRIEKAKTSYWNDVVLDETPDRYQRQF
jgi:hypothetical protein